MSKFVALMLVLFATSAAMLTQELGIDTRSDLEIDREHTQWIDQVMQTIAAIKPGMTRRDLARVFTEEGGLSTRTHQTYVYRQCPYIKVEIEFSAVDRGRDKSPDDKIVQVSRPFLEYSIMD
jgi:hypothetical protein